MWQESNPEQQGQSGEMTDVIFRIECLRLTVDHAAALCDAVCIHSTLLHESHRAGVHPIHVAGSQNGWERPVSPSDELLLSKRTRFVVRVDKRTADKFIHDLVGKTLDINGSRMTILSGQSRSFLPSPTLLSRYTYFDGMENTNNENAFIGKVIEQCESYNFQPSKVLCGRANRINTHSGPVLTRSVLLADVPPAASIILQDNGLGKGRLFGCGLLIPHKDTGAVN